MNTIRKMFKYRGKRIRFKDKNLIVNRGIFTCIPIIVLTFFLSYAKNILHYDYKNFTLSKLSQIDLSKLNIQYLVLTMRVACFLCLGMVFLYLRFFIDHYKQLEHRQKLARLIIDNRFYESVDASNDSFFKDWKSSKKEKIVYFPRFYYQMKDGYITIATQIVMNAQQDNILNLEKKLETGLFCDLVDKELTEGYVEYKLLYDTIGSRITIDDVVANDGVLRLMKNTYWEYDSLPHMLVSGGTGGGKTYFILTIIKALLETDAELYILDPKNSDLAAVMDNVYFRKDEMIECLNLFYDRMMSRTRIMKQMDNYKTGSNYAALGLPAHFLIFDEYVAFMDMIGRESLEVMSKLKQIVMLGRQMGFFVILACQRPDANYLGNGIRDQFMFRVALGKMSALGYNMMFGEENKDFFFKNIKGRGYADCGYSTISEFYTPLVPKHYDFIEEIKQILLQRKVGSGAPGSA